MKKLLVISLLVMMMLQLAACGGNPAQTPTTVQTEPKSTEPQVSPYEVTKPVTITFWHSLTAEMLTAMETYLAEYHDSQKLVTVKPEYVGGYTVLNEKLVAAQAAGSGLPAISVINVPLISKYADSGLTEVLNPYIEATKFDLNDFYPGFIDQLTIDGNINAMPFMISSQVFFYNATKVKEAGLTFPTEWKDMDAYVTALYNKYKVPAWTMNGADNAYFYNLFINRGAHMINEDGKSTGLDSEIAMDTIKTLKNWAQKGYIKWNYGKDSANNMTSAFLAQETLGAVYTTTLTDTYLQQADFEVAIGLNPNEKTAYASVAGGTLIIPAKNDQLVKSGAWDFMKFLLSPSINRSWAISTSYLPTRKSVLDSEEDIQLFVKTLPPMEIVVRNLDRMAKKIQHPLFDSVGDIFEAYMAEIMNEDVNVEERVAAMCKEINALLTDQ